MRFTGFAAWLLVAIPAPADDDFREIKGHDGPVRVVRYTPDGTKLIATCASSKAIYVWDLRLLRQELADLGLDWDWPEFPPPTAPPDETPLQVTVDAGQLSVPDGPPSQRGDST